MTRKTLLLGAGGFIGAYLTHYLGSETDDELLAVDIDFQKLDWLEERRGGVRVPRRVLNVRTCGDELRELIQDADVVVDLIAHANPAMYVTDPLDVVELNFFENWKIAQAALESGATLVQFSTCEVYGLAEGNLFPFGEDRSRCVLGPIREERWIYSCAKQLLERMIYACRRRGLSFCVIRPFNFVGPNMDYLPDDVATAGPRVVPHFISCLLKGQPLPLVDGGHRQRSYTYIDDAIVALGKVFQDLDGAFRNQIVNVGHPSNETSIRDLALTLIRLKEELTGEPHPAGVVDIAGETFYGEGYADCDRRIPDLSKLNATGWEGTYDLESTLRETLKPYLDGEITLNASWKALEA